MDKLDHARKVIDSVDKEMAALYETRMQAVKDVIEYKLENNLPIFDSNREQSVIDKNILYIKDEKLKGLYVDFLKGVMNNSKVYQNNLKSQGLIGYQGTIGAFSHIALKRLFPINETKAYTSFESVFKDVLNGTLNAGILPFENSYTGEVGEVLDLLYKYDVYVENIYSLKIDQNLIGIKGTKFEDIKQVYSITHALNQCEEFFNDKDWELVPYTNTALSAKFVAEHGDKSITAVGSRETAENNGLEILAENINSSTENFTKFIIIKKDKPTNGSRFNVIFDVGNKSGMLSSVIQLIAEYNFNLESIKSRPIKGVPWGYYIYAEVVGDYYSNEARELFIALEKENPNIKIVGIYENI